MRQKEVAIKLERQIIHKTNHVHFKKLIRDKIAEIKSKGGEIWMVLSCKDKFKILYRDALSMGAPIMYEYPERFPYYEGVYMRVVDHESLAE